MFKVIVEGTAQPSESKEVNQLYSAEREKTFVLNSGNTALIRTGIAVDVPKSHVAMIVPAGPNINVMTKLIPPGMNSEIVLTVVNDSSVAKWIEPGELLAELTIAKVAEKSNAKREQTRRTTGRKAKGNTEQGDAGSSKSPGGDGLRSD